ncbi:hypothetical protein AWH56_018555 [Anaerobacillus isosaccharinicus]|uniref:Uncharacterized protein n=1 Tax=Anaerobacillus isosaccharinicus TaxID=1532552 RepID=A0A1S2LGR1_9BACI|nr:hypothetical protein [Anaerobacillus isosaccharinicus]MBA5587094.1 hypothetical protein [Anaerobacillus isosaccharinicus]QOY34710.1 hypothetical protein AWH56_018555 [Anaerobacillus isosaccharinicus]
MNEEEHEELVVALENNKKEKFEKQFSDGRKITIVDTFLDDFADLIRNNSDALEDVEWLENWSSYELFEKVSERFYKFTFDDEASDELYRCIGEEINNLIKEKNIKIEW